MESSLVKCVVKVLGYVEYLSGLLCVSAFFN